MSELITGQSDDISWDSHISVYYTPMRVIFKILWYHFSMHSDF